MTNLKKTAINFSYQFLISTLGNCKPRKVRQYCIISKFNVWNKFIQNLFTRKFNDCMNLLSRLQNSNAYNKTGTHLYFKSCRSQSPYLGQNAICCSVEWPLGMVYFKIISEEGLLQFMNIFQHVQCRWNNFEIRKNRNIRTLYNFISASDVVT